MSAFGQHVSLVLELVGKADAAQAEALQPVLDFFRAHGVHHFGELCGFVVGVTVGLAATETVEFLVVKILYVGHGITEER